MTEVPTARGGSIDSSTLGFTLLVEHLITVEDQIAQNWPEELGDEDERIARAIKDLEVAKDHGIDTLCDRSIAGIGRNIRRTKRIAERSPVNILAVTGLYTWRDIPFRFWFQQFADPATTKTLDYYFQRDIEEGIGGTGVRAAMVKCAIDRYGMTEGVETVTRAVAKAHRRTGAPISTHTNGADSALEQIAVLRDEGVDMSRVLIGHIDKTMVGMDPDASDFEHRIERIEEVLATGVFVSIDMIAGAKLYGFTREMHVRLITQLIKRGYIQQLSLSHDLPSFSNIMPAEWFEANSSFTDYARWTELQLDLFPALREEGVSDAQIDQIMVTNPRTILETREQGSY